MIKAEKYDGWFWWNIGSVKTFFCSTNIFQNWPRLLLERWIWFLLLLTSFINPNIILCWPEGLPYSSKRKAFSKGLFQPRRQTSYLSFFLHKCTFLAQFFSTWKHVKGWLAIALCSKSNGSYDIKDFGTLSLIFSTSKYFRRKCQPCPSFFLHPNIPDKWKRAQLSLDQMKKKERVKVKS